MPARTQPKRGKRVVPFSPKKRGSTNIRHDFGGGEVSPLGGLQGKKKGRTRSSCRRVFLLSRKEKKKGRKRGEEHAAWLRASCR